MPVYTIVELHEVRKPVWISPHFSCWQAGDSNQFLLNDLTDWWPPEELLPLTVVRNPARGTVAVLKQMMTVMIQKIQLLRGWSTLNMISSYTCTTLSRLCQHSERL